MAAVRTIIVVLQKSYTFLSCKYIDTDEADC